MKQLRKQKKAVLFEGNRRLKKPLILILLFVSFSTLGQVDDLKKKYLKQKGKERVLTMLDICYYQSLIDNDEARSFGKMAEIEARKIGDSALLANVWNDWSIAYFYGGDLDSSLLLNKKALNYRTLLHDTLGMAKSLNKIASTYYEKGIHDKSLAANLQSLAYFKQFDAKQYYCQVYTNIGNIYDRTNKPEKALEYHTMAIEEAILFNNQQAEAIARVNRANSLRVLNQLNEARKEYMLAIPIFESLNMMEHKAGVYQGIGVLERTEKNTDAGIRNFELALKYYREAKAKGGVSLVLVNLGNCYLDKKDYQKAESYMKEGLEIALEMKSYYNIRHAYKSLTRLENLKGNFEEADKYFELYITNMDSIYNDKSNEALAEMQVKYETEQKELELAEEKIKTKNATIWLLVAGSCILILVVVAWYIAQRRRIEAKNAAIRNYQNLERERSRIARDLHDNLGAELTMITSKIDMKSFKASNDIDKGELEEIGQISRSANHMLRETIWSIHQDEISLRELHSKAKAYAERVFADQAVMVSTRVYDEDCVISPAVALHLFRITQESVNNAFKYANCSEFSIIIRKNQIELRDNGTGFDATTVQKGYGLQNMQERANEMQATLTMESNKENGTKIVVSLS